MKPYQQVPIQDCNEPLVFIPSQDFVLETPHPYEKLGAPYGDRSPYVLRQGVLERLIAAQQHLEVLRPGWRILVFDAYRPVAVQQFMVDYTFMELVRSHNRIPAELTEPERQNFWQQVYQFWAVPNLDPHTPPPHSTGAAIDVSLVDETGAVVDMGSPIDEVSPRSFPNAFAAAADPNSATYDAAIAPFHQRRQLLHEVMTRAGFRRHLEEWWHFSYGDQMWVWLGMQMGEPAQAAIYGRVMDAENSVIA